MRDRDGSPDTLEETKGNPRTIRCDRRPQAWQGLTTMFLKRFEDGTYTYSVPTNSKDVLAVYVKGCRKKFRLLPSDGVTDEDFYS